MGYMHLLSLEQGGKVKACRTRAPLSTNCGWWLTLLTVVCIVVLCGGRPGVAQPDDAKCEPLPDGLGSISSFLLALDPSTISFCAPSLSEFEPCVEEVGKRAGCECNERCMAVMQKMDRACVEVVFREYCAVGVEVGVDVQPMLDNYFNCAGQHFGWNVSCSSDGKLLPFAPRGPDDGMCDKRNNEQLSSFYSSAFTRMAEQPCMPSLQQYTTFCFPYLGLPEGCYCEPNCTKILYEISNECLDNIIEGSCGELDGNHGLDGLVACAPWMNRVAEVKNFSCSTNASASGSPAIVAMAATPGSPGTHAEGDNRVPAEAGAENAGSQTVSGGSVDGGDANETAGGDANEAAAGGGGGGGGGGGSSVAVVAGVLGAGVIAAAVAAALLVWRRGARRRRTKEKAGLEELGEGVPKPEGDLEHGSAVEGTEDGGRNGTGSHGTTSLPQDSAHMRDSTAAATCTTAPESHMCLLGRSTLSKELQHWLPSVLPGSAHLSAPPSEPLRLRAHDVEARVAVDDPNLLCQLQRAHALRHNVDTEAMEQLLRPGEEQEFPSQTDAAIDSMLRESQKATGFSTHSCWMDAESDLTTVSGADDDGTTKAQMIARIMPELPDVDMHVDVVRDVKLITLMGRGSFGEVYEGIWTTRGGDEKRVAVKLLRPQTLSSCAGQKNMVMRSFASELNIMTRCHHPHVVRCYGGGIHEDLACLLLEFMDGGTLEQFIHLRHHSRGDRPTLREVLGLTRQISSALTYLHPVVVHGDLKPANILLRTDGICKLADFGLSRVKLQTVLSQQMGGTLQYLAPEALKHSRPTEKTDIYSLGMLMWEVLMGVHPWARQTQFQIIHEVCFNDRRPVIPEHCPRELKSLIKRCWMSDPEKRPSAFELFRKAELLLLSTPADVLDAPLCPVAPATPPQSGIDPAAVAASQTPDPELLLDSCEPPPS